MQPKLPYYSHVLKEQLNERLRRNSHYSLRSFALLLCLNPGLLSNVINGKRKLSLEQANKVCTVLKFDPIQKRDFLKSINQNSANIDSVDVRLLWPLHVLEMNEINTAIISEWEHFVCIDLMRIPAFKLSVESISACLKIPPERSEKVLSNLIKSGLVAFDKGSQSFVATQRNLSTTDDVASEALKSSHKEAMRMGLTKLDEVEIDSRDFSSVTINIQETKIQELKSIIRDFRKKILSLSDDQSAQAVYQIAVQAYPVANVHQQEVL